MFYKQTKCGAIWYSRRHICCYTFLYLMCLGCSFLYGKSHKGRRYVRGQRARRVEGWGEEGEEWGAGVECRREVGWRRRGSHTKGDHMCSTLPHSGRGILVSILGGNAAIGLKITGFKQMVIPKNNQPLSIEMSFVNYTR